MRDKSNDPLIESLMALAVSAAPLIRRARESGIFKAGTPEGKASDDVVDAEVVPPKPAEAVKPEPAEAVRPEPEGSIDKSALQDIIVRQAMRIGELEAEVTRLKASAKAKRAKG